MMPDNHVRPSRSHSSVFGATVSVKSLLGVTSGGSLNTLVSMPTFGTEMLGFIHNGPMRTRTEAGSGPASSPFCAEAPEVTNSTRATAASRRRFDGVYKLFLYRRVAEGATGRARLVAIACRGQRGREKS